MIKLREDDFTSISHNGGFDAHEHCLCVLDGHVVSACSTCGGDICGRDGMVLCQDVLS